MNESTIISKHKSGYNSTITYFDEGNLSTVWGGRRQYIQRHWFLQPTQLGLVAKSDFLQWLAFLCSMLVSLWWDFYHVFAEQNVQIFSVFLANFIIFEYRENSTVITNGEFRLHIVRVRNNLHLFHLSDTRRPFDHLISCVFLLLLSPLSENTMSFEYKRSVRKLKWNEKVMELKIFMSWCWTI